MSNDQSFVITALKVLIRVLLILFLGAIGWGIVITLFPNNKFLATMTGVLMLSTGLEGVLKHRQKTVENSSSVNEKVTTQDKPEVAPAAIADAPVASTTAIVPDCHAESAAAPSQIKEQPAANSSPSKVFYKALSLADGSVQVVVTAVGLSGRQFKGPDGLKDKIATIKIPGVTFKPGNNAAKQERTLTAKVRPGSLQVRILGAIFLQLEALDVLPSEGE